MHDDPDYRPKARREERLALLLVLALVAGLAGCGASWLATDPRGSEPWSFLALGDTGRQPKEGRPPGGQLAVGLAMADEDRRAPVDRLIFLGDNFYPHGVPGDALEERVRLNLAEPYCRFVRFAPAASEAVRGTCTAPESERHPVGFFAVLGNHDYHLPESPAFEAERVPELIESWQVVGVPVERIDLPQGVSLVFYDSELLRRSSHAGELARLTAAVREAPGPFVIAATHRPLDGAHRSRAIERALVDSGVRLHLHLAGHLHDLRVATPPAPLPALQVVSGAGGGFESNARELPYQTFIAKRLGFARVDLDGAGAGRRLRVRMFAVSPEGASAPSAELVSAWSVTVDGAVRDETPQP